MTEQQVDPMEPPKFKLVTFKIYQKPSACSEIITCKMEKNRNTLTNFCREWGICFRINQKIPMVPPSHSAPEMHSTPRKVLFQSMNLFFPLTLTCDDFLKCSKMR